MHDIIDRGGLISKSWPCAGRRGHVPGRQRRPRRGLPAAAGQPRREGHAHGPRQLGVGPIYLSSYLILSWPWPCLCLGTGAGGRTSPGSTPKWASTWTGSMTRSSSEYWPLIGCSDVMGPQYWPMTGWNSQSGDLKRQERLYMMMSISVNCPMVLMWTRTMYLDITINVVNVQTSQGMMNVIAMFRHHKECHHNIQTVSALYNTHNSGH